MSLHRKGFKDFFKDHFKDDMKIKFIYNVLYDVFVNSFSHIFIRWLDGIVSFSYSFFSETAIFIIAKFRKLTLCAFLQIDYGEMNHPFHFF